MSYFDFYECEFDLAIDSFLVPGEGVIGEDLSVVWNITNLGNEIPDYISEDLIFLSDDENLDEFDTLLFSYNRTISIISLDPFGTLSSLSFQAQDSYFVSENISLANNENRNIIAGDYYLILATDGNHDLEETDENNNISVAPISLLDRDLASVRDITNFNTELVHRFYEFNRGVHFYTTDENEVETIREASELGELLYQYESLEFTALSDDIDALTGDSITEAKPVYRYFNTDTSSHFYTMDEQEAAFVGDTLSNYIFEGIEYYAFVSQPEDIETIPVFRMLNSQSDSHLYPVNRHEIDYIQTNLPNFSLENHGNPVFYVFDL